MIAALRVLAVVVSSLVFSGLVGELLCRVMLEPGDYLTAEQVDDELLGLTLVPNSAGHDAWGFRNASVPETADFVALGDSWTYGLAAPAAQSWPRWLARSTGKVVYNLGVYGYGPTEYLVLLKRRAIALAPELVIVGLAKSDFHEAYTSVYTRDEWAHLRSPEHSHEAIPKRPRGGGFLATRWRSTRNWLRFHSVLYRVIERGPIGRLVNRSAEQSQVDDPASCVLLTSPPFESYLRPPSQARQPSDPRIQEGIRLSLALLREISEEAARNGIPVLVVLFPSKMAVYQDLLPRTDKPGCSERFERAIAAEAEVDAMVKDHLERYGIAYVETLAALRHEAARRQVFPASLDGHPTGEGYRVISRQIEAQLAAGGTHQQTD